MKNIVILGSTGSIGRNTCEVIEYFKNRFRVVGMAAGSNLDLFEKQVRKFRPRIVSMISEGDAEKLKTRLGNPSDMIFCHGKEGLAEVASYSEGEMVVVGVSGGVGLIPTARAIEAGKDIALANKETMVTAGEIITTMAKKAKINIMPVDSEHSAVYQCLLGNNRTQVEKIILTASGGPFRKYSSSELKKVVPEDALKHPSWNMGNKVTIDSATLMNKGLEVIEAYWLFGCNSGRMKIDVVIHPESIVHSMVQYVDGSVIAQMAIPDMKLPILYALSYPERMEYKLPRLDFHRLGSLSFGPPDLKRFPCLKLAFESLEKGRGFPAVLNAANEVAVYEFLAGNLGFTQIHDVIETVLSDYIPEKINSLDDIIKVDGWAREIAAYHLKQTTLNQSEKRPKWLKRWPAAASKEGVMPKLQRKDAK